MQGNITIQAPFLILCEGRDELNFLTYFIQSQKPDQKKLQIINFGGNDDLSRFLKSLINMEGFSDVHAILIMRDAETSHIAAQQSIFGALERCQLPVPDKIGHWAEVDDLHVGVLLFPTCDDHPTEGALEDLCLQTLKEEHNADILHDIDGFLTILSARYDRKYPRRFKSQLHTYFSVTDEYVSLKIGEACRAGAIDFGHQRLSFLHKFIEDGLEYTKDELACKEGSEKS